MSRLKNLTVTVVLLAAASATFAQSNPQPAAQKVVLVELFTSEGCSDCPPADAMLKRLDGKRTEKGQLIVGISEHVTYWNQQGWVDPFSQEVFTARQRDYGARFSLDDVYTPQMVVNGEAQMVGGNQTAIAKALQNAGQGAEAEIRIGAVTESARTLNVSFETASVPVGTDLYAVIADDTTTSKVLRGENGGRTLDHVAVARSLTHIGKIKAAGAQTISVPLPSRSQESVTGGRHLILFVQQPRMGKILAAVSRPLSLPATVAQSQAIQSRQ